MALQLVAKLSKAFSHADADCYIAEVTEGDGRDGTIDFWFPKGTEPPETMDIFVEFEREEQQP